MDTKKQKILVVDDDVNVLDLLNSGLEVMGYSVTTCESAAAAEKVLEKYKPDIILMDVNMPIRDGISLCRNLKMSRATSEIPIIMLTAFSDKETFHDAMLFGADGFLAKPFEMVEVKKKIEEYITKQNIEKEEKK
jgi:DNA-binding response OmpR family regulator